MKINDPVGNYRVLSDDAPNSLTENYIQKAIADHPLVYQWVNGIIPTSWQDSASTAALITATAVSLAEQYAGPDMVQSLGGKITSISCFQGSFAVLNATIDLTLNNNDTVILAKSGEGVGPS